MKRGKNAFLSKSSRIAAATAEGFSGGAAREAVIYLLRALSGQNFIQRIVKKIAQRDIALMVKAARHNRSIHQHAQLVAQAIAEYPLAAVLCSQLRPVELFAGFQPHTRRKRKALSALPPRFGKVPFK